MYSFFTTDQNLVRALAKSIQSCWVLVVIVFGMFGALPVSAHENQPAIVDVTLGSDNTVSLVIKTNLESILSDSAGQHESGGNAPNAQAYEALRALSANDLKVRFSEFTALFLQGILLSYDGNPIVLEQIRLEIPTEKDLSIARQSTVGFTATIPSQTGSLGWALQSDFGDSVLRVFKEGDHQPLYAKYVGAGNTGAVALSEYGLGQTGLSVFANYLRVGFDHILPLGLDHILFIIGLFFLSVHLRPLITQVTMFTIAHTITLALGMLGWISAPGSIVEPLIAASIVFVAIENMFTAKLTPWRPFIIFGFGLLHGLGFAGILTEFGLPQAHFASALIAFNIGVEIGQLTVIAACFIAVGYWFRHKPWYRRRVAIPVSLFIAIIALYWVAERTGLITA